jgi:hypothetical protein
MEIEQVAKVSNNSEEFIARSLQLWLYIPHKDPKWEADEDFYNYRYIWRILRVIKIHGNENRLVKISNNSTDFIARSLQQGLFHTRTRSGRQMKTSTITGTFIMRILQVIK